MIVLQILKSKKEMKKIAFMFAVAAMFVACGNGNKPAEEVATDSTEVTEVTDTLQNDSLQNDSLQNDSL
jgi:ABC-type glycerol-3-phosphate transport system substrate-binding protein